MLNPFRSREKIRMMPSLSHHHAEDGRMRGGRVGEELVISGEDVLVVVWWFGSLSPEELVWWS